MAAHEEDDKLHLRMAMDTTVRLENKTVELENKFSALKAQMDGEPLEFKLTDYRKKKENNAIVQSPSYYTSPSGYRMAIRVYVNGEGPGKGTHVSVFPFIIRGRYDAQLKWPLIGDITFTLVNQKENMNHYQAIVNLTASNNAQVGLSWGKGQFISHSALYNFPVKNRQYLKDDTLHFRMSLKLADHKP